MIKIGRSVYWLGAWLFVAGVALQLFLAGLVVVAGRIGWGAHRNIGHLLALPLVLMLVSMYAGRLPGSSKKLTWLLFAVYVLQADVLIFLRGSAPVLAAVHPVLALVDFALGLTLALRAWPLLREAMAPAGMRGAAEASAGR